MLICRRNDAAKGKWLVWKLMHSAATAKYKMFWGNVPFFVPGELMFMTCWSKMSEISRESRDYL